MSSARIDSLVILFLHSFALSSSSRQEEALQHEIAVKIYQLSPEQWTEENRNKYNEVIAARATATCAERPTDCGLTGWNNTLHGNFSALGVLSPPDASSPRSGPSLVHRYALELPPDVRTMANATQFFLHRNVLKDISKSSAGEIFDVIGYRIIEVSGESVALPPNLLLNGLIVGLALLFLTVLIIFTICGYRKMEKDEERERLRTKNPPEPVHSINDHGRKEKYPVRQNQHPRTSTATNATSNGDHYPSSANRPTGQIEYRPQGVKPHLGSLQHVLPVDVSRYQHQQRQQQQQLQKPHQQPSYRQFDEVGHPRNVDHMKNSRYYPDSPANSRPPIAASPSPLRVHSPQLRQLQSGQLASTSVPDASARQQHPQRDFAKTSSPPRIQAADNRGGPVYYHHSYPVNT